MSYQAPSVGPAGLSISVYPDILNFLVTNYLTIYGTTGYLANDSSDYQWISIISRCLSDTNGGVQLAYNNRSPLGAVGAGLDGVAKCNGIARKPAVPSTVVLQLTGTQGAVIANGIVQDVNNNLWLLPASVTIGAGGTVLATAACQTPGPISANPGTITVIVSGAAGWNGVTNPAPATLGLPVETDSQFKARQALSVALPSQTMVDGTIAGLWATSGVTRVNVEENPTSAADANGCPPHSITCVVEGGADQDVAQTIYNNRGIGSYTNGTTTINITDPGNGNTVMPIRFSRPTYVPIYVSMTIHGLTGYTTAVLVQIQADIVAYLNSLSIGETVVYSELYGAALQARPDPSNPLFSIKAVTMGVAAAPTGTVDIPMSYNQAAQCQTSQVVMTAV